MAFKYHKHEIPESYLDCWQHIVDEMAKQFDVSTGVIMRAWSEQIEVLIASHTKDNPYIPGEKVDMGTGLYCETVMATGSMLQVPDALADKQWKDNPAIKLNMIMYMGMPLYWPDGEIFGSICVMDCAIRRFDESYQKLMAEYKEAIESGLREILSSMEQE